MMRYQRVSPDCLGLPDGRKPTIRACKENDEETITTAKFPNYPQPLRPRSGSASASANPLTHDHQQQHQHQFPRSFDSIPSENPKSQNSTHHDVLLQWGHRKRSRGSRAENRATGDDPPLHSRQHVKIQRRAAIAGAEKIAAAAAASAMPPPPCGGGGYTRGANLRACTPLRDSTATYHHNRSAEERSGGKRSPQSPPLNHNHHHPHKGAAAAAAHHNNNLNNHKAAAAASTSSSMNPEMRNPSDQETIGSGSGGAGTAAAEKVNLEHFEWPRIYVSLSRKEKEDDFLAMKGTKLPQRPKKRPKNIDKSLQYCFPGMWLSDLARGRYDVREKKCVKKKRRGLKGMESMDSDSE